MPEAAQPIDVSNFYRGKGGPQLIGSGILGAPLSLLRDIKTVCAGLGDTICYPTYNPLNTYSAEETTWAIFGQVNYGFNLFSLPVTGNLGGRYVTTELHISGFRTSNNGQGAPIDQETSYKDFLPSFNARIELKDDLFLRLAAAKQLTRPSFSQLSPNLSIGFANANATLTGSAGNPDLRPLRSTSYDASLEYYFTRNGYTYLSMFKKEVSGFIQTVTTEEPVAFPDYPQYPTALITRPKNGDDGTIDGFEVGVQTFFDFLPAPFDGLGMQANYTRVNSTAPGPIAGTTVPLVGLSKNSYNLVGYYEKGKIRARLAYTYRDDYVDTTSGPGSGALPIYAAPVGYLAASFGYKLNSHVDLSIDADNITNTEYGSYFGFKDRPRFHNIVDRRIGAVIRLTY
jgi:TonB-dependent receptor